MKVDGLRYAFDSRHRHKKNAESRAKSLRRDGYSARIKRNSLKWYEVWYSAKRRR